MDDIDILEYGIQWENTLYISIEEIDNISQMILYDKLNIWIKQIIQIENNFYWISYDYPIDKWEICKSNNKKLENMLIHNLPVIYELTHNKPGYVTNTELGEIKIIDNRIEINIKGVNKDDDIL